MKAPFPSRILICAAVALQLAACQKEEDPVAKLFELEVQSTYPSATTDNWVIISSLAGEPIASAPFESGETVELSGSVIKAGDLINVTLVILNPNATSANDRDNWFFNSYKDIPVGEKWYLKRSTGLASQTAGTVGIKIANLPGQNSDLSISSFNRRNNVTSAWTGSMLNVEVGLRKSPSDLFFSIIDATPRYMKIDAAAGQDLTFDYHADFHTFDNVIPVTFSTTNLVANIQGFGVKMDELTNTDLNYHTQSIYTGNSTGIKVGFNNGYSFYQTSWTATLTGGRRLTYFKLGNAPTSSSFDPHQSVDFFFDDNRIESTVLTCSPEFDYCINEWFVADEISVNKPVSQWQIACRVNSVSPPLVKFPDEMLSIHPYLESVIPVIHYQRSTFFINLNDGAYNNYIDERFRSGTFKLYPRETFSLAKG